MISDRMFRAAGYLFQLSTSAGVLSYNFDKNTRRLTRSSHGYFFLRIHFLHICVGFMGYILQSLYFYLDGNRENFNFSYSLTLTMALILQVWIMQIIYEDDAYNGCNAILFYMDHINRK